MIKGLILKQIDALKCTFKDKFNIKAILVVLLFCVLNALKIACFNFFIIPTQTQQMFEYKFKMAIFLVLIIYPIILWGKSKVLFIISYVLQALYIMANISYNQYFHSYLHIMQWLTLFKEGFSATKNLASPISIKLLIAFIDLPVFIYIVRNYFKIHKARQKLVLYRFIMIGAAIFFIISMEKSNYAKKCSIIQLINDRYKSESPIVEGYGVVTNEVASLLLSGNEKQLINDLKYRSQIENNEVKKDKPNFVIIQVESLDANAVKQKHNGSYIAPFLQEMSSKCVYYPYLLSYHKGGSTSDSEFSAINGVEPFNDFPAMKLSNYSYPNSIMRILGNSSYQTLAFHGNVGNFFNRDIAFSRMGANEFFDINKMSLKDVGWGAPDHEVFKFAENKLSNINGPFLSYIITMTSHGPFTNARNYYNNDEYSDIKDEYVRDYFNSISYVDETIKNFVTDIRSKYKNTYIFIYGDHDPNMNSNGYKQASFNIGDKFFEFVPLFIITPDNKQYREEKEVASFLDILPTVLYNSGIKFTAKSNGNDLINRTGGFSKIPFKGEEFERTVLFDKIEK